MVKMENRRAAPNNFNLNMCYQGHSPEKVLACGYFNYFKKVYLFIKVG